MRPLILDRLRSAPSTDPLFPLCREAANEIKRLMTEVEAVRRTSAKEIERLRGERDALLEDKRRAMAALLGGAS